MQPYRPIVVFLAASTPACQHAGLTGNRTCDATPRTCGAVGGLITVPGRSDASVETKSAGCAGQRVASCAADGACTRSAEIKAPDRAQPIALGNGVELLRLGGVLTGSTKTVRRMPPR